MTAINRNSVRDLRPVIERAINDVLGKVDMQATLGRITFVPGQEFRCKLTVTPRRKMTVANSRPKVGEFWNYGGKLYRVETDNGDSFIVSRPSRSRSAYYVPGRGMVANCRVKASDLQLKGAPIR